MPPFAATTALALSVATLAATATLTACGTAAATSPGGPALHSSNGPHLSTATPAVLGHPAVPGPPAGSRTQAAALARQLLSRLRLPTGARRLPHTPVPSSLTEPAFGVLHISSWLDQYQLFALTQPMAVAAAFLAAHGPAGLGLEGTSSGSGPGSGPYLGVGYRPRSLPAGIAGAELVLTVVSSAGGGSLLRADAQVTWYPPRSAAEYIDPGRYHVLTIRVWVGGRRPHTVHKVVTSQAFIARLARALNEMQALPPGAAACPEIFADYQVAFSVSRQSRPAVVVTANETGCGGAGIIVSGRTQPGLQDRGMVAALVDQVVRVSWEL